MVEEAGVRDFIYIYFSSVGRAGRKVTLLHIALYQTSEESTISDGPVAHARWKVCRPQWNCDITLGLI